MAHQPSGHDETHVGLAYDQPLAGRRASASGFLLDALRRRRAGRMVVSGLTVVLFLGGLGLFTYPFFTDIYTNEIVQQRLADEFVRIQVDVDSYDEWASQVEGQTGKALTMIAIPALGVETLVVEGTSPAALRAGAGHYPNTPLPGQAGNVAIAGHRTTYGKPFNELDALVPGDEIWLVTPVGDHRYVVADPQGISADCVKPTADAGACITTPQDWGIIGPPGSAAGSAADGGDGYWLTLTTCHPKGSAAKRLVVRAHLVESLPPGAYDGRDGAEA